MSIQLNNWFHGALMFIQRADSSALTVQYLTKCLSNLSKPNFIIIQTTNTDKTALLSIQSTRDVNPFKRQSADTQSINRFIHSAIVYTRLSVNINSEVTH